MKIRRLGGIAAALSVVTLSVTALTGCGTTVTGQPVSVYDDPYHVAGMDATEGPNGVIDGAPESDRDVENTDGGVVDQVSAMAVSDLEEYWAEHYSEISDDEFDPVDAVLSWDSDDPSSPDFCGDSLYQVPNAFYCFDDDTIAWDRGVFMPDLQSLFGDMALVGVLAHEYGHAIQAHAGLVDVTTAESVLVSEQQADCFEGAYTRWVAEGNSSRFTLNTSDGLNQQLANLVIVRDPTLSEDEQQDFATTMGEHGSAFERISAWQMGFTDGPTACAAIDAQEIDQRRGDMAVALPDDSDGDYAVTDESVGVFVNALNIMFEPENPPTLSLDPKANDDCADAEATQPVSYCPATNTIAADVPALEEMSAVSDGYSDGVVTGDNSAYSILTSRYMLALQHERGVPLQGPDAALRTACLTGVTTALLFDGITDEKGETLSQTAGDLDEAISGMLTNGKAATDVSGETVPSGFSRVDAFRAGVLSADVETCYQKFS